MAGNPLSYGQFVTLQICSYVSSSFSIAGSLLIMVSIARQQQKKPLETDTLHQLLVGLSICDIVSSLGIATATFMLSADTAMEEIPWAFGNQSTCIASAFIYVSFATAASCYNCFISMHFWRMVRRTRKRAVWSRLNQMKNRLFRIVAHSTAITVSLILAIAGVATNSFHPTAYPHFCYFNEFPIYCDHDPNIDCEQGLAGSTLGHTRTGVIGFFALVSIACTIAVYVKVRSNLQRSSQYAAANTSRSMSLDSFMHSSIVNTSSHTGTLPSIPPLPLGSTSTSAADNKSTANTKNYNIRSSTNSNQSQHDNKQRQVALQAVWYTLAYLNSVIFVVLGAIVVNTTDVQGNEGDPRFFTLLLYMWVFMPLQGALNFIIYIRPRINAWNAHYARQKEQQDQYQRYRRSKVKSDEQNGKEELQANATIIDNTNDLQDTASAELDIPPWWVIMRNAVMEEVPSSRQPRRGRRPRNANTNTQDACSGDQTLL
ncbi:unknown protein [Seminavis robusta]|uniref:G-protein coupled receptors family 1 profile domain-containing protein n=1 Tax=Seminavis robusta TaxID=568900 RepID=A0A9N8D8K6_9STRA|nr:unknown protein [Seminavis robusta]|eukprot:Sro2_g001320.1 n/a (486) ;mRNA; r:105384-106914